MRIHVRWLLVLTLSLVMLVSGCSSNVPASTVQETNNVQISQGQPAPTGDSGRKLPAHQETARITVYRASNDAMYLVPEIHELPRSDVSAKAALELLLAPPTGKDVVSPVPAGTKVKKVTIKDHIAYVDFNDKIVKNNSGGSTSERLLVGAIVNTLTEFPEIEKVQILVEGKIIDTISGHMDISEPLSRSAEIIKK